MWHMQSQKAAMWDAGAIVDHAACYIPHRSRGRPQRKWDDLLSEFCFECFANERLGQVACNRTQRLAKEQSFVEFVNAKLYG